MFGLTHKLALSNLIKNRKLYYPYALMSVLSVAIVSIFTSLSINPHLSQVRGANGIGIVFGFGLVVVLIVVLLMILYANGFVLKQRSKELGLYSVLGLEKKHLLYMTLVETTIFALVTISLGLVLGVVLDKLFYALLLKLMQVPVKLVPTFQWRTLYLTSLYFIGFYLVTCLLNAGKLGLTKTLNLVKGSRKGEAKGRFLLVQTILGLGVLAFAYYMAQDVSSPLQAMGNFFIAVLLVIFATYLLFNAGIIVLLRFLQQRDSYYQTPTTFISVSNLIFRMRKNAMGLATLAILSTMVLVTLVGGLSIYIGGKDLIATEAPNDFIFLGRNGLGETGQPLGNKETARAYARQVLDALDIPVEQEVAYSYRYGFVKEQNGNSLSLLGEDRLAELMNQQSPTMVSVFSASDYKAMTGQDLDLSDQEIAVYQRGDVLALDEPVTIDGKAFAIKTVLSQNFTKKHLPMILSRIVGKEVILVVEDINSLLAPQYDSYYLGFDSSLSDEEQASLYEAFDQVATGDDNHHLPAGAPFAFLSVVARADTEAGYFAMAGSLFFIGMFLTVIFLTATILVIYYKQVSEGYEDRSRFVTMRQLGIDEADVRRSVRKQLLLVFFLPVTVAILHLVFAFKMLCAILLVIGVVSTQSILMVAILGCGIYVLVYSVTYGVTSQSYRSIIRT